MHVLVSTYGPRGCVEPVVRLGAEMWVGTPPDVAADKRCDVLAATGMIPEGA